MTHRQVARLLGHASSRIAEFYIETRGVARRDRLVLATARRQLDGRMSLLHDLVDAERLEAFRDYAGAVVATVSPLLLGLCELAGLDVDELACSMRPHGEWRPWLCGRLPADAARRRKGRRNSLRVLSPDELDRCDLDWFAHAGTVATDLAPGGVRFGCRVADRGLEMAAMLGEARLRTHGSTGWIKIGGELPATLVAAAPGRPLNDLVGHPVLDLHPCVVTHVDEPDFWGTKVHFALEPVRWTMPWARARDRGPGSP